MELGAIMELLGEEVSQLWGRRHLYIVGETIQPLPPKQPRREWYYRLEQYYRGYFRGYFRSGPKTRHKSSGGRHGCNFLVPLPLAVVPLPLAVVP